MHPLYTPPSMHPKCTPWMHPRCSMDAPPLQHEWASPPPDAFPPKDRRSTGRVVPMLLESILVAISRIESQSHSSANRSLLGIIIILTIWCHFVGCACFAEICQKYFEFQILWSLSSVHFHTLTLQLPIQTPNSVAPELQVLVSSLEI